MQKGFYGIKSLENFKINFHESESLRRSICFNFKNVKVWFNFWFNIPIKSKSSESRMGKGKGKLKCWISCIKKGFTFVEVSSLLSKRLTIKIPARCSVVFKGY